MRKGFFFRSITGEGQKAKIRVEMLKDVDCAGLIITKFIFSKDPNFFGVIRKVGDLYFCEEKIVLKETSLFAIANEAYKFFNKEA